MTIYKDDPGLLNWYVVFQHNTHIPHVDKIFKKNFCHVWAFTYDPETHAWLRVESTHKNLVIRPVPKKMVPIMLMEANKNIVVQYDAAPSKVMWKIRFFVDCSSVIAHLLGVDIFYHTPYRLFCALRQRGGTVTLPKGISKESIDGRWQTSSSRPERG